MDPDRQVDPTNPITAERVGSGPAPLWFVVAVLGLGVATTVVAFALGGLATIDPAETQAAQDLGLDVAGARALSAVAAGAMVAFVGLAGRRLWHNPAVGILAALIAALDPLVLQAGSLVAPHAVVLALAAAAWWLALALRTELHILGGLALAGAAWFYPPAWRLGIALACLVLLRGHVYAAPRHAAMALGQNVALPLGAAVASVMMDGPWACMADDVSASVLLAVPEVHGVLLAANPATWFGGLASLGFLAGAGLTVVLRQVRVARLPGRLQLRLPTALPVGHARALWLLLLLVVSPPGLWIIILAVALAAGITHLGQDAPGFGLAVALAVLAFAILVLVRTWAGLTGDEPAAVLELIPWARTTPC